MSNKLINFLQESVRLDKIRFNSTQSILEVFQELMTIKLPVGCENVVPAAIVSTALDTKRVNLHHKFNLNQLQQHTSPAAMLLAVMYAKLNNPYKELWLPETSFEGATLRQLRMIDLLFAIASNIMSDDHVEFAKNESINTKVQETNYKDLETKRQNLMKESNISSGDLHLQMIDPQILIYVAWISHQVDAIYTVWGLDKDKSVQQFHVTPSKARAIVLEWHEKFTKVHIENLAQRDKIAKGEYRADFQFTPL